MDITAVSPADCWLISPAFEKLSERGSKSAQSFSQGTADVG